MNSLNILILFLLSVFSSIALAQNIYKTEQSVFLIFLTNNAGVVLKENENQKYSRCLKIEI